MNQPLSPNELAKEGKAAYKRSDYLLAAQSFEAAAQGYQANGDALNEAEMCNNSSVAYLQAGEAEEALRIVIGTEETFAQAGDLGRHGMALGNQAAALEALDRLEEAEEAYLQCAKILEQAGEDKLRADVMKSVSAMQLRQGRQLEALASMQSGLEGVNRPSPKQSMIKRLLRIPFEMINKKQT